MNTYMKHLCIFTIAIFIHSCSLFEHKPANDLEAIAEDVLDAKQGIEIRITPINK